MNTPKFPTEGQFPQYFEKYIRTLEGKEFLSVMNEQVKDLQEFISEKSEEWGNTPYAEGKWNPKEVLGHCVDTERVMGYRALCIARGDKGSLPGFDQDLYASNAEFGDMKIEDIMSDFKINRIALLSMIRMIPESSMERSGNANGADITTNSLLWFIPAHFEHHLNILKERY